MTVVSLKEMKVVARADLNDNALNGNFFGSSQYGTGNIAPIAGDITATVTILQPSQRPFILKDDLFTIPSETHGNVMLLLLTMRQI